MLQIVKIRLRKSTRVFTFLARDILLSPGDGCVVRTDRGLEYGICMLPPEDWPEEREKQFTMTVVRKASTTDETTFRQILADEEKAKALCTGKILERQLPMHLVDVEYTFDRHKVVFYFTADERVDFRELVRDLAHDLKTRIELRHIQVRDKAKIVGGLAACGRQLCCATWMGDFMPISMRMAKRQNLSLNPGKISGQCGRLMCCLSYENHLYEDKKKKAKTADVSGTDAQQAEVAAAEWSESEAAEAGLFPSEADGEYEEAPLETGLGEAVYVSDPESGERAVERTAGDTTAAGSAETGTSDGGEPSTKPHRRSRRRRRRHKSSAGNREGSGPVQP